MDTEKLQKDVADAIVAGQTRESIYLRFLQQGASVSELEEAFKTHSRQQNTVHANERTIKVIISIGVLMIGAGVFAFIAANWQEMTRALRISIIFAAMLLSYAASWYFQTKSKLPRLSQGLLILGTIIYGAGIFLIGQMYNVRANWPDGFILWMLGALAMGTALESYSVMFLAGILGIISLSGHPFVIFELFNNDPLLLTSSLLLLVASITTLITGWWLRQKVSSDIKDIY